MSNIPHARELVSGVLQSARSNLTPEERADLRNALRLMTRRSPMRRAPTERIEVTRKMKKKIVKLARDTEMTNHDIAIAVGLRNGGRVSEVLQGLR